MKQGWHLNLLLLQVDDIFAGGPRLRIWRYAVSRTTSSAARRQRTGTGDTMLPYLNFLQWGDSGASELAGGLNFTKEAQQRPTETTPRPGGWTNLCPTRPWRRSSWARRTRITARFRRPRGIRASTSRDAKLASSSPSTRRAARVLGTRPRPMTTSRGATTRWACATISISRATTQ